ncbi:uncharacterized protein BT62DRAFT_1008852 [Guyanagaster necrorhizus]|uniref:Alpha-L-rhamnosidase C-terminal domain-containing protein n=1 Tax=Guyanagaster necrorhizus TaxID=856835 RepID=A0A9P7VM69_9AGAR|nr:uncharacterized protein BT62DRAFT_1008852 [Guyanagaster necrorhizus MCA 3950]KAG7443773.1 hypothetical protein BT62DRAFT_1008852 [Guyanagaster necrorhizus MCA 3950]
MFIANNNATLGVAGPTIVDGAKRDRDMGIAVPSQFVSTFDLIPTRNALSAMFAAINPETGALPDSGPPLCQLGSDTYHCWTLIGTHNYYLYSGDDDWLSTIWTNYTHAIACLEGNVDSTGLMDVTGLPDWARLGGGGCNAEGNAILYKASSMRIIWAMNLSPQLEEKTLPHSKSSSTRPSGWNDANSFAVLYNLTLSNEQKGPEKNWNDLGPVVPELPDTTSRFNISGFEPQAHFKAGKDDRALDLLRREWDYILYTNLSVQSTLLEGFMANGSLWYVLFPLFLYSSGLTSALTLYVMGLSLRGATWSVSPLINGGLPGAEGGFETLLGWFGMKWALKDNQFFMEISTPKGTNDQVKLLRNGSVVVDEEAVDVGADGEIALTGGKHGVVIFS